MRHVETLRPSNCFHESRPQMQPRSKVSELLIDGSQRATMSSGVAKSGSHAFKVMNCRCVSAVWADGGD